MVYGFNPDEPVLHERIMVKEIQKEIEVCTANKAALSLFNNLLNQRKQIILISDMYLSEMVIKEILTNCGYNLAGIRIYVSSEYGVTK